MDIGEIELSAASDVDRAELAGPVEAVLKNVRMDGAKVGGVEGALHGPVLKFRDSARGRDAFKARQFLWGAMALSIPKDRRAWIDVRINPLGQDSRPRRIPFLRA